ncbi:hypothetical protein BDV23DRAFT_156692 [Aspergillus alliaceus]|uniref:Calcineurin-like phosphoesterase domain-containing protein n=1 Tax=Petromyces alliaceus TaxID=209559 RepID=A0A5N7C6D3_PETAA|nr:hypothetical protein BDV23DRAFT_156692 [Aspergillus alliaceus]
MSYSYQNSTSAEAYRPARRDYYADSSHVQSGLLNALPPLLRQWGARLQTRWISPILHGTESSQDSRQLSAWPWRILRHIFTITNGLAILWFFTLWWGERTVFQDSVDKCVWENWEKWPRDATPHHVAFIADPQLVDPHTYPGRPWPLSTLTVKFTDQYLRRSFSSIQRSLGPDSVLFLGDLFDGGREWATAQSLSPEKRYQKYKDSFWKKEYHRFVKIFSEQWNEGDSHSGNPRGRRMIASLPGNHDLGFGTGVQLPVRDRFQAYFGKSNRVDIIGNHTFVSVDTVSLSAMDQPDPETGSSGSGDGHPPNERIWKEAEDFLNNMNVHRGKAETEELRTMRNQSEGHLFHHKVVDMSQPTLHRGFQSEVVGFPAVLLTHVPLYRKPATPCGPLRERYPPSSGGLEEDERNALSISAGYQYQNVLTQTISKDLVTKAGPNLIHVYSGDDHDYCEVTHREFSGSPKEITVKSLSWAMGVRQPGFLLTSLWNPVDPATGKPSHQMSAGATLQNHLCILPDQISIFIRYGLLFGITLAILLARAFILVLCFPSADPSTPILPLSEFRPSLHVHTGKIPSSSTSSSTFPSPGGLASRIANAPPRYSQAYSDTNLDDVDNAKWKARVPAPRGIRGEFIDSVKYVATIVFAWYFFLIWRW